MMSVGTRIYVAIFLVSLIITLASVLVLEIYQHPTAALILHPVIVLVTAVRSVSFFIFPQIKPFK